MRLSNHDGLWTLEYGRHSVVFPISRGLHVAYLMLTLVQRAVASAADKVSLNAVGINASASRDTVFSVAESIMRASLDWLSNDLAMLSERERQATEAARREPGDDTPRYTLAGNVAAAGCLPMGFDEVQPNIRIAE